jgi:hypothetical protein
MGESCSSVAGDSASMAPIPPRIGLKGIFAPFRQPNLKAKVGHKRAVVAVARKLAVVLHAMWSKNEPFRANVGAAA